VDCGLLKCRQKAGWLLEAGQEGQLAAVLSWPCSNTHEGSERSLRGVDRGRGGE
jgi:hypothetical protein